MNGLTILIPAFNEAPTIERVVRKVSTRMPEAELIVVDDGSTDGTAAILDRLAATLPLRLLRHKRNQGKGAAIRAGLSAARGAYVLIQDADLEYDPDDYPALLAPVEKGRATAVYGSRFLGPHRASYFWHRFGNWLITLMVNLLFNASLTDVETGYKLFPTTGLRAMALRSRSFEFEVEVTCKWLKAGQTIFEVPVSYYGRSYAEGKKITWRDGIQALWIILRCRVAG